MLVIDDAFIREWHPRYDETEGHDPDYDRLVNTVAQEMDSIGTISQGTFLDIWKWKGAIRTIRFVELERYDTVYAPAFRRAFHETSERMLPAMIGPGAKLAGIGAPSGSTIVHFMHPTTMPIIDVRTVEVLHKAGLVRTKQRDLDHYNEFRKAINRIKTACPRWSLREIDKALFAYHKQVLDKKKGNKFCPQ